MSDYSENKKYNERVRLPSPETLMLAEEAAKRQARMTDKDRKGAIEWIVRDIQDAND